MILENANRIWYEDNATVAKFLMGGIGTGNFSIGSRGQLCDWELWNGPSKGTNLSYSFFAIRTESESGDKKVRVLESRLKPPYERANGYEPCLTAGVPMFDQARIAGEVSAAIVELRDSEMPVEVDLYAFSPFIPLNPDDSGIPGAILRYKVTNTSSETLQVSVAGSLANAVGFKGIGLFGEMENEGAPENEYKKSNGMNGIYMINPVLSEENLVSGSMALATTAEENVSAKPYWVKSSHWDGAHEFWHDFEQNGDLTPVSPGDDNILYPEWLSSKLRIGAICCKETLTPGESKEFEFIITWHFPNRPHHWPGHIFRDKEDGRIVKNYYTKHFPDAWAVGNYLFANLQRLESDTDNFRKALYGTTLPSSMLDALSANISVLRSTTCFRIEDGSFLGWEGTFNKAGSCEGNCSHVWAYNQTLAFLFPSLERDMRRIQFLLETAPDGEMSYRSNTVFGYPRFTKTPPAADGQMATIVQLYRDWKLSGDDEFLKTMWEKAALALEYAFVKWDQDGDFIFETGQYNTFDIEFFGMDPYMNTLFYAALKAAEEIASYLGEEEKAQRYKNAREASAKKLDSVLYNGEYYVQKSVDDINRRYQYNEGCLANQLFGQQLAHIAGLGYLLPEEHVKSTIRAVYNNNFLHSMKYYNNVQRAYALNDDAGLICCSWPNGGKPAVPFIYSDEVWSGIEYQVAAHLIYEGEFDHALTIVEAIRNRHNGIKRNPWNEEECGNHYVRSMASWGLLIAASGFGYDLTQGRISFSPKISQENFSSFYSTGKSWGIYRQQMNDSGNLERSIEVLYGNNDGIELR